MSVLPEFTMDRVFNAPRDLVWKAWTAPDLIARWFGPKGCKTRILAFDLRPGGICHFEMRFGKGPPTYGRFLYQTITPPEQISWRHSFADKDGEPIHHPGQANWPLFLRTVIKFEDLGATTRMLLFWTPLDAKPHEIEAFEKGMTSMEQGWGGLFEVLDPLLEEVCRDNKEAGNNE